MRSSNRSILVVICWALATVVSAVSALNVAIPSIAHGIDASQTELSWIIDAYALTFAVFLLPFGALGDRVGRRKVLMIGLAMFSLTSLAAMMTSSPQMLIAFRGLLGVSAALVMPATLATITTIFPEKERVKGVAIWTGLAGASAVLGLLAAGLMLEVWSWKSVFGLNVSMATIAFIGTARVVPESRCHKDQVGVDLLGTILSIAAIASVVFALIEAPQKGWGSITTGGCLCIGCVLLILFVWCETVVKSPLLNPRLFGHPAFTAGALSILVQFMAFFGLAFIFLQYLQLIRGYSPFEAACGMFPLAFGLMPGARISPKIVAKMGRPRVCGIGLLLLPGGLLMMRAVNLTTPYWFIGVALWVVGVGMGLALTPATSSIADALPVEQQGIASAINDLARELGCALGIATLGSILNSEYRSSIVDAGLSDQVSAKAQESVTLALRLGPSVASVARSAFVKGLHSAFLMAACSVSVCALLVVALLVQASHAERHNDGNIHGGATAG